MCGIKTMEFVSEWIFLLRRRNADKYTKHPKYSGRPEIFQKTEIIKFHIFSFSHVEVKTSSVAQLHVDI